MSSPPAHLQRPSLPAGFASHFAGTASGWPVHARRESPAQPGVTTETMSRTAASLESRVDVMERRIIQDCLARHNHRRKETAAELGISRVTLYNKMKKFGLM